MKSWSPDRKSTRLNSSHLVISYAVFCLKKKKKSINSSQLAISHVAFCAHNDRRFSEAAAVSSDRAATLHFSADFSHFFFFFFLNDPAPPEISPFPLPAPLPI